MELRATIRFRDADSSDEALAIVRSDDVHVALCLSLRSNGDLEVVMTKAEAKALCDALRQAAE